MKTIWKFPLALTDSQTIDIPEGAKLLAAQIQGTQLNLWAEVDPDNGRTYRTFAVFGTGHRIPADLNFQYIDTFQLQNGALVFHVYEELR